MLTRGQIDPFIWTDCKLGFFLFMSSLQYSSLLLVLMSIEKCFAVFFPLKSRTICTVKTAKWATGIVGVLLAGYNIQYFIFVESQFISSAGLYVCDTNGLHHDSVYVVDSVLYSFAPFTLMLFTNSTIVLKFMKTKCKSDQNNSTESTNQALVKSATRGTAMVVTVSVTFLVLTAPTAVNAALESHKLGLHPLYRVFMNITQYLNHSINGVLYIIVGTRFRKELFKLFCGKERPEVISTSHRVNNTSLTTINGSRT